jgi:hypothetical protein
MTWVCAWHAVVPTLHFLMTRHIAVTRGNYTWARSTGDLSTYLVSGHNMDRCEKYLDRYHPGSLSRCARMDGHRGFPGRRGLIFRNSLRSRDYASKESRLVAASSERASSLPRHLIGFGARGLSEPFIGQAALHLGQRAMKFQFHLGATHYSSLSAASSDETLAALWLPMQAWFLYEYDLNIPGHP